MAAGRPVGTIFVELDLDDSRYLKGQKALYKSATTTSLNIEQNFKNLGIKSSAHMDLMRQKIMNSYNMIANSSKATANDILRAEQAKNAKLKALDEQQYGHRVSMMEKVKKHWIGITAAITASYFAAQKAWNLAEMAASFEQSSSAFASMAQKMGRDAKVEFAKIKEASAGLIDDKTLVESANKAMSLGIPIEKLGDLMVIARAKSRDMGTTASQAFSDIATGVGRASPLILDNLGLVLKVGSANEAMAAKLGKTVQELTDKEKKQAILNATLEAGKEALTRYNLEQTTTKEKMDKLRTTIQNIQLSMGTWIVRGIAGATAALQTLASGALTATAGFFKLEQALLTAQSWVTFGDRSKLLKEAAKEAGENAKIAMEAGTDLAGKAADNFAAMTASTKDFVSAAQSSNTAAQDVTETIKGTTKETDAAAEAAARLKEQWEDTARTLDAKISMDGLDDLQRKLIQNQLEADNLKDKFKELPKELKIEAYAKIDASRSVADNKAIADEAKKAQKEAEAAAKKRLDAERDIYSDLRGYSGEYFEATKRMIEEQAEAYRKLGIDEVAVAAWVKEETINAYIEMGKESDNYRDGVAAALEEIKRDAMTAGEAAYEITKEFANKAQSTLSDVFFDAAKGELKSFSDYFTSFTDALLRKWADTCAQMIIEWVLAQAQMKSSGGIMGSIFGSVASLFGGGGGSAATLSSVGSSISTGWNTGGFDISSAMAMGSANGNVFESGKVIPFRRGGIVDRPTIFPMANGTGLMGEAGPEAVVPLKRTASGNLGIASSGSSPKIDIQIINNSGNSKASVQETRQSGDVTQIKVLVEDIVSDGIGGGKIHNSLRKNFKLSPALAGR